jgi:hypothetical protein
MQISSQYGDDRWEVRTVEAVPPLPGVDAVHVWIGDACVAKIVYAGDADRDLEVRDLIRDVQSWIYNGARPSFGAGDWPTVVGPYGNPEPLRWRLSESCAAALLRNGAGAEEVLDVLSRDVPVVWTDRARAAAAVEDVRRAPERDGQFAGKARAAYRVARAFYDLERELVRAVQRKLGLTETEACAWLRDAAQDAALPA